MEIGDGVACCQEMKPFCQNGSTASKVAATLSEHKYSDPGQNGSDTSTGIHSNGIQNGLCSEKSSETSTSHGLFPRFVPTISREEVPLLFREPHVKNGFRVMYQPWSYYICSIFQLHNESMNVWTHILAAVLLIYKLVSFSMQIDFIGDQYSWPLLAGLLSAIILYIFSSAAHCLQSKSELVHYVAFMFDYAGIGLYGLGSVILHIWYCSEPKFYEAVHPFFIPVGTILGFLISYCCTIAKVRYSRPYPFVRKVWQMTPVGSIYVVLVSPIIHRLISCYAYSEDCNDSIPYHLCQVLWFVLSGIFFASDIPQRWLPGYCDHFFHSHQLFHFAIMMSTMQQMDGVLIDFQTRAGVFRSRPIPSFADAFGPIILVLVAQLLCITYYGLRIKRNIEDKKKL